MGDDLIFLENIDGSLNVIDGIDGNLSSANGLSGNISVPEVVGAVPYDGEYDVTPTDEVQILETRGLMMRRNVTIGAIPSNYGRVSWNGFELTVS